MDVVQHIKELSPCQMVVAVTEPIPAERRVFFIRNRRDQDYFACATEKGYVLTDWGRWKAEEALQTLQEDVAFFMEHFAQFRKLCVKFAREYNRLDKLLEESRSRRRTAVHWRDRAVLFRQARRLEEKRNSLYRTMYESEFGPSARFLPHQTVLEFLEGISIPSVML